MRLRVLYFARAREVAGTDHEHVELEQQACSADELLDVLLHKHPALQPLTSTMMLAVNQVHNTQRIQPIGCGLRIVFHQEYVDARDSLTLKDGDEVALIPPVSGG